MPLSIERGSFILGQATTSYLDTVTYTCEPGYDLLGPMTRYCQADGEWSETEPVCQCETDMHRHILHTNSQCPPDTSYTVHCSSTTTPRTVVFAENCGPLSSIENGYLTYTNGTNRGSVARYNCQRGYTLSAPTTRECQFDGEWSAGTANCTQGRPLTAAQNDPQPCSRQTRPCTLTAPLHCSC